MARETDGEVLRVVRSRYWRAAEASIIIAAWRASGQPVAEFCRRYGIDCKRLGRWAAKLKSASSPVRFHPVRVVGRSLDEGGASISAPGIELVLRDGLSVRISDSFTDDTLRRVLSIVEERD